MADHHARHRRRLTAALLAAGLTGSLLSLSAPPAQAAGGEPPHPLGAHRKADTPKKGRGDKDDKLGAHDRGLLQKAESKKEETVTVLLATDKGGTKAVRSAIAELGGHVGKHHERLGYVRATVPTGKVEQLAGLSGIRAVDLDETVEVPDPSPATGKDAKGKPTGTAAAPGKDTAADNPYLPTAETGAVDFTAEHPEWDGRGITVGILDTGVDLGHPALRTTTTGKPKIVDSVTATDPVLDGDGSWVEMRATVTAQDSAFRYSGIDWTVPADGDYRFQFFKENVTWGGDLRGDVNRDGDTGDRFGVLYRSSDHTVWVDTDQDHTFAADEHVRPYAESGEPAHFGTDDPDTAIAETVAFTVEYRDDVDLSARGGPYQGRTADFVNIGLVAGAHGTHVAGITAGHGLFGGEMNGAAPGAQIVSERVCVFAGGCTAYALAEGMIDVVVDKGADVVNLSIGGLPALNDGQNARGVLYSRLIDEYGVQIFVSAGNDGPGMNTVSDPSVTDRVVSVGASVSKETWWADYGSEVNAPQALFPFSARGPRADGGMKPNLVAPGAAVSAIPNWLPGSAVPQAGYELPAGYGMFNGTSMASPQAAGAAALLLSAAADRGGKVSAATLRSALTGSAHFLADEPAYAQGAGLIDVPKAWKTLAKAIGKGGEPTGYTVDAPVCGALSGLLVTPGRGAGLYNRCAPGEGGQEPGRTRTYEIGLTRDTAGSTVAELSWLGNDGTFKAPKSVELKKGRTTEVGIRAHTQDAGAHSAVLRVDDPATPGIDKMVLVTVVVADDPAAPSYTAAMSGESVRNRTRSMFVAVPEGAGAVRLDLSGLAEDSQTRFLAIDPQGKPVDDTAVSRCYANYSDAEQCDPYTRVYRRPMAGVWEFQVESRRTSPLLSNPYRLSAAVQGARMTPPDAVIGRAAVHAPVEQTFTATNAFGPVTVRAKGGSLGALAQERPTVGHQEMPGKQVAVPRDATRFEVSMGNAADPKADLDLYLLSQADGLVGSSTNAGSVESIALDDPKPGNYLIYIAGTDVPSGSTAVDIQDTVFSKSLGTITVDDAEPVDLAHGEELTVRGRIVADARPLAGRRLVGRFGVATGDGTTIGSADVLIGKLTQPEADVTADFGPALGFALSDTGRIVGSQQVDGRTKPIRWDAEHGVTPLDDGGARSGHALGQSRDGDYAVGQLTLPETGTRGGLWNADGELTVLPLPDWEEGYTYDRAYAVNDSGTVVGNVSGSVPDPETGRPRSVNDPFSWTKDGGFTRLQHLTGSRTRSEPLAINDDGVIVGHSQKDGARRAVRWAPDGGVTDLGTLPGMHDSTARGINAEGVIVGFSGHDAFVLTPGDGMVRLPDYGFDAKAVAVNDAGWVIGTAERRPDDTTAVVWDPEGRMYDVGAMVDADRWRVHEAIGINHGGEIAFYAYDLAGGGRNKVVTARLP